MADNMLDMGEYKSEFNDILGIQIESQTIYRSTGLPAHMVKRKHYKCLKYIDFIPDIIANPDYIGINPNEKGGESVEFIKKFGINVLVGVKLDSKNGYLYVSTFHDIQESKLQRRLHSGRIKAQIIVPASKTFSPFIHTTDALVICGSSTIRDGSYVLMISRYVAKPYRG